MKLFTLRRYSLCNDHAYSARSVLQCYRHYLGSLITSSLCSASSTRLSACSGPHLLLNAVLWRRCCWAPASTAVDRYALPARCSAANPPYVAAAARRTDTRPLHRVCSTYYAGSVSSKPSIYEIIQNQ